MESMYRGTLDLRPLSEVEVEDTWDGLFLLRIVKKESKETEREGVLVAVILAGQQRSVRGSKAPETLQM